MYKNTTVTTEELSNTFFTLMYADLPAQANRETPSPIPVLERIVSPFFQQEEIESSGNNPSVIALFSLLYVLGNF